MARTKKSTTPPAPSAQVHHPRLDGSPGIACDRNGVTTELQPEWLAGPGRPATCRNCISAVTGIAEGALPKTARPRTRPRKSILATIVHHRHPSGLGAACDAAGDMDLAIATPGEKASCRRCAALMAAGDLPIFAEPPITDERAAPRSIGPGAPRRLRLIAVDLIRTPVQVRAVRQQLVEELAAELRAGRPLPPVTVHETASTERFELGPGRHRLEAHRAVGRELIEAFVEEPLDHDALRLEQAQENLHRADLTPLEEADAVAALAGDGQDLDGLAARLGRTRRWVERRLALGRLSPRVRELLDEGWLHLAHAELIARLASHADQEEVAGLVRGHPGGSWDPDGRPPRPVSECRDHVERRQLRLDAAPWKLDADGIAGKPACSGCPQNSANAPTLFDDVGGVPEEAHCLNSACHREKAKAASRALVLATNEAERGGAKVTPARAAKAAEARDVSWIDPAAVVDAAKRRKANRERPGRPTADEQSGAKASAANAEAHRELREAQDERWEAIRAAAVERLGGRPFEAAALLLLREVVPWTPPGQATEQRWLNLARVATAGTQQALEDLEAAARKVLQEDHYFLDEMPPAIVEEFARGLGVEVPPEPVLEQFTQPAAAAPAARPQANRGRKARAS